jgi:hypothetical protein
VAYLGAHAFVSASAVTGVASYDPAHSSPGVNLYVSGDVPEARLIALDKTPIHMWRFAYERLGWTTPMPTDVEAYQKFWSAALPDGSGGLYVASNDLAVLHLDRDSRLIWAQPGRFHHVIVRGLDVEILALTRERHRLPHQQPR